MSSTCSKRSRSTPRLYRRASPTRRVAPVEDAPRLPAKLSLAHLPTPLDRADRLGGAIGLSAGQLWIKRDDCTGLAGGGNKARKLEYLCAEAVARGCDTLVTGGARQSNHVRMTAAAANKL